MQQPATGASYATSYIADYCWPRRLNVTISITSVTPSEPQNHMTPQTLILCPSKTQKEKTNREPRPRCQALPVAKADVAERRARLWGRNAHAYKASMKDLQIIHLISEDFAAKRALKLRSFFARWNGLIRDPIKGLF